AVIAGYGPAWATVYKPEPLADCTLKLVKDDVPIDGRVVDLEGRPIRGVTVRVMGVNPMAKEDLSPWLAALAKKKDHKPIYQYRGTMLHPAMTELSKGVTTGADGKLRLTGIGRERIVSLRFEGPTIEIRDVYAMTRPGPTIHVIRQKEMPEFGQDVYHGA